MFQRLHRIRLFVFFLALTFHAANAQVPMERWNLYWQATSIAQYHGTFRSPYESSSSLQSYPERDVSLTTTLFFGLRLDKNTQIYFNPEIAGGKGFSGVNGLANASNGELPRVASATPKPYIARLYVSHDFGFGKSESPLRAARINLPANVRRFVTRLRWGGLR